MNKVVTLVLMVMVVVSGFGQKEIVDRVIAIAGGELVLLSDLEEQYSQMVAQSPNQAGEQAKCNVLGNILVGKLLLDQAKLDSIEVGDAEVEVQLTARIDQILQYMNGDVKQFESYYGASTQEVKQRFREDLKNQLYIDRMRQQILSEVTVTPGEVIDYFNLIPYDSLPYFNAEVEVGEIVVKPVANSEEKAKTKKALMEIRNKIINGEASFFDMAKKYSADGSGQLGGDLGWAKRGKYVPAFEAEAYKLDKDEISPVFESEFGYHIIQMLERRGNSIHVRHILLRPEITDNDYLLAKEKLNSVRTLIQADSLTFGQAVKKYGDEKVQSYSNNGRMTNPVTGTTFFEIGDLDPDVYFTIDSMSVNDVSAPFKVLNPGGEVVFKIVQLQSKTDPHKANLKQDYSKIQQAAIQSKQGLFINNWVEDKIKNTFIAIDRRYENCPMISDWNAQPLR